jgi:glycosyltransferase involved in cell wall biosynthesis
LKPVGVSILTNANRSAYLNRCVFSLLENCHYRPLVISIFDNGSLDDTSIVCQQFLKLNNYGIEWRVQRNEKDMGCAAGTNAAHNLIKDMEIVLHLESDFRHLTKDESGVGKLWLREAVAFMETGEADYIYLRRMRSDHEMATHWFHQWKKKIIEIRGPFQRCQDFWYSNNPSLFRMKALYDCKILPLNEDIDGAKGTTGWSRPELSAPRPTRSWLYGFGQGMFVHDG